MIASNHRLNEGIIKHHHFLQSIIIVLFLASCISPSIGFSSAFILSARPSSHQSHPLRFDGPFNLPSGSRLSPKFSLCSKWDNLDDEDDDGPPIPRDMKYIERNVLRQSQNFVAIRDATGPELTNDVYVRDSDTSTFWFIGKVARVSDVSIEQAVARQWPLIEQHARRLRPIELYPKKGADALQIWIAPGDSELDVAYNRPHIQFQKMKPAHKVPGSEKVRSVEIGFQGEVYQQNEEGFRTIRTQDGRPANPEVQPSSETRAPTDAEMKQIQEMLDGKDLGEMFGE